MINKDELEASLMLMREIKIHKHATDKPSESMFGYWLQQHSPKLESFQSNEKTGKWCIFISPSKVDAAWENLKKVISEDKLMLAKVSTKMGIPKFKKHVICVYTKDWSDIQDLERTREVLREIGFKRPLKYKRDIETINGVYGKNEFYLKM